MAKRALLSFGLGFGLTLLACGDDSADKPAAEGGKSGSAAGTSASGSGGAGGGKIAGSGGSTGTGTKVEGDQCATAGDAECAPGLRCVTASAAGTAVRICARPCTGNDDVAECGEDFCDSPYTMLAKDAHCINLEPKAFAICGAGDTSFCANRTCLYPAQSTIGICVDLCNKKGPDEDAGAGVTTKACVAPQTCLDYLEEDVLGLCGAEVPRGEVCGEIEMGKFCGIADVCVPDDTTKPDTSTAHCREDCSATNGACSQGTCTTVGREYAYCK